MHGIFGGKIYFWIDLSQNWPLSVCMFALPRERGNCNYFPKNWPMLVLAMQRAFKNLKNSHLFTFCLFSVSNQAHPNIDYRGAIRSPGYNEPRTHKQVSQLLMVEGTRFLPKLWDTRSVMSVVPGSYNLAEIIGGFRFQRFSVFVER